MGQDKGKARKSLSEDKKSQRRAEFLMHYTEDIDLGLARSLREQLRKKNLSPKIRKAISDAAASAQNQFDSKTAKAIIDDTQGGPKMQMKGFGN